MRKVARARFHTPVNAGGTLGEIGGSLPTATKQLEGLEMFIEGEWLYASCKFKGVPYEMAVPSANCQYVILLPEEPPTAKVKPKAA